MVTVKEFWPHQKAFFDSGPAPCLLMGGVGCGKTVIGLYKMLYLLDMYPGSRGVVVRQRFSQLKKTTVATLRQLLPPGHVARRNDNEGLIRLKSGSELLFMHLDKPDSLDNLKSLELSFAMVDQAEDITSEAFDILCERVGRWSGSEKRGGWPTRWPYVTETGDCIPPPYIMLTAYSPGYDHWLTSRFWEHGADRERYRKQGYLAIIGSTRDNKALTKQYVAGRLAMGSEYVARYVDATEWGANEGRIFDLSPQSIVEPTDELLAKIKHHMRIHRVMDHGDASPTAVLWYATDSDGNVFYFREYMKADQLISQHRENVFHLSKADGTGSEPPAYYSNYADPSIFAKSRGRGVNQPPQWSVADEWREGHIVDRRTAVSWRPANNDEAMTINRVREYLREDPRHRNPLTNEMGAPRAYFIRRTENYPNGCHEVLTDIRAAKRVVVGTNADGSKQYGDERDDTVRDHLLDCVRYSIGMRPALGLKQKLSTIKDGEILYSDYEEFRKTEELRRARDRRIQGVSGGYGY